MSKYIRQELTSNDYVIYNCSDWHVGSKAFHEDAALELIDRVESEGAFLTFGGDALEGKTINSPHFNPDGLHSNKLNIHSQADAFVKMLKPIADRVLMLQLGNHELYLKKDFDVVGYICQQLGISECCGDYQTWLKINNSLTLHFWHGRPSMPRGAKDPIQREANQKAWLKNKLAPLAGSAQAQYMAHTHHTLIVQPIEQYALLDGGENVKGRYFTEKIRDIEGQVWVPTDARWFVNTGTFRRGGGFDYCDYSEIAGYVPPAIACTKTTVENNSVVNIEKVLF
jgi:hypothetical protein